MTYIILYRNQKNQIMLILYIFTLWLVIYGFAFSFEILRNWSIEPKIENESLLKSVVTSRLLLVLSTLMTFLLFFHFHSA